MAHVIRIWVHDAADATPHMRVYMSLKPSGEVSIDVPLPPSFHAAILGIAQATADQHEALMRAEILGDQHEK